MKKVNNTQLNAKFDLNVNEDRYSNFKNDLDEYINLLQCHKKLIDSYITNILAKKSSIGTNTIEKVIVDEKKFETELVAKGNEYKNSNKIQTVENFMNIYEKDGAIDYDHLYDELPKIHKSLFKGIKSSNPGKYKKIKNWIPEKKEFIEPGLVANELNKLSAFITNSNLDPIIIAAVAHAKFIAIHPFSDGNGRIGRLLSNKIIEDYYGVKLWIDEAMSLSLTTYVSALDAFHFESNVNEISNYFIDCATQQIKRNKELINDLIAKSELMSESSKINIELCAYIISKGSLNVAMLSKEFGIHRNTAKGYLDKLNELGYMEVLESSKAIVYIYKK